MYHPDKLSWIDLSHNHLTTISEELQHFKQLKTINLHANYIADFDELLKLAPIESLRNLTIHGNPLDTVRNFRLHII